MRSCFQTHGQNMLDHGLSVWKYTQKLINGNTVEMKLPSWYTSYKDKILSNIHDLETIRLYNIYHDCGKHLCRTVDADGKVHYPNHAEVSKQAWLNATSGPHKYEECSGMYNNCAACMRPVGHEGHCGPPYSEDFYETIGNLIGLDMIMHTESKEEILARNLSKKDMFTLLITALAECHANAEMFGGIDSTSFKIKFKKIERIGKFLCSQAFESKQSQ